MATKKTNRQELITDIRNILGDGMVDVELDPKHYEQGIDLAVDKYRQKSSNSTEEAYIYLELQPDVQEYTLASEVIEVKEIFRKIDLNWFIPAFVKSNVGSSLGATDELRINLCPFFSIKFMKDFLISEDFI